MIAWNQRKIDILGMSITFKLTNDILIQNLNILSAICLQALNENALMTN